jgi:hypothetical protein
MPMVPANAVNRSLSWSDFPHKNRPAPPPGATATAASTQVNLADTGGNIVRDPASKRFKLDVEPTVRIDFSPASWVADFVFKWPQPEQDALLDHEQIHYMIAALCGRDLFNALQAVSQSDYPNPKALAAAVADARKLRTNQDIQDKYDADTKHQPTKNAAKQAVWATAVRGALKFNQPLRDQLRTAALI